MIAVRCAAWAISADPGAYTVTSSCPAAQRGHGGQPGRAGSCHPAGKHHRMAAIVFVTGVARRCRGTAKQTGRVGEDLRRDRVEHAVEDADVGDHHLPAGASAGLQQMARLPPKERHREVRLERRAERLAARTGNARRQIDGDDRYVRSVHGRDRARRLALHGPRQPGAEQAIDDEVETGVRGKRLERLPWAAMASGRQCGIAVQRLRRNEAVDHRLAAGLTQEPRGGPGIAAIVAGAGQNRDAPRLREGPTDGPDHGCRGPLHHCDPGDAAANRQAVGFGHLHRVEQRKIMCSKIRHGVCLINGHSDHEMCSLRDRPGALV